MMMEEYAVYVQLRLLTVPNVLLLVLVWSVLLDLLVPFAILAQLVSLMTMEFVQPVLSSAQNVNHVLLLQHA